MWILAENNGFARREKTPAVHIAATVRPELYLQEPSHVFFEDNEGFVVREVAMASMHAQRETAVTL